MALSTTLAGRTCVASATKVVGRRRNHLGAVTSCTRRVGTAQDQRQLWLLAQLEKVETMPSRRSSPIRSQQSETSSEATTASAAGWKSTPPPPVMWHIGMSRETTSA